MFQPMATRRLPVASGGRGGAHHRHQVTREDRRMADRQTLPRASPGTAIPVVVIGVSSHLRPHVRYPQRHHISTARRVFLGRVDRMQRAG